MISFKDILDPLAFIISLVKLRSCMGTDEITSVINTTKKYIGRGHYASISMIQKDIEIYTLGKIINKMNPKIILEIGTARGGTLFFWSRISNAQKIISIDLPGGKFGGGYNYKKQKFFKSFAFDKSTKIKLIRRDSHSQKTLELVVKYLDGQKVDLLFIDGDHSYKGVKKDFELYSPLLNNDGIIACHDIVHHKNHPECNVDTFWNEIKHDYNYLEIIEDKNQDTMGIGILYKGDNNKIIV